MVCCCRFLPRGPAATACAQWVAPCGESLQAFASLAGEASLRFPRMATEDAALLRAVVKFRAGTRGRIADAAIDLSCEQHAENRSREVNPAGCPDEIGRAH